MSNLHVPFPAKKASASSLPRNAAFAADFLRELRSRSRRIPSLAF